MKLSAFHKQRLMFIVVEGTVMVAKEGDSRTHVEWLADMVGITKAETWIDNYTRGYILAGKLVAYVGTNFSDEVNTEDVKRAIQVLNGCVPILEVGLGAYDDNKSQPWPSKKTIPALQFIM